jgi:hypothetical protein
LFFKGRNRGANVLLEASLGKNFLYLACRHHMLELIAKKTFTELFGETKSPDTAEFEQCRNSWEKLDKTKYKKLDDKRMCKPFVKKWIDDNLSYLQGLLSNPKNFLRCDYKELAELCVLMLGGKPSPTFSFKNCGVTHHARWMCKIIYTFKIYLFRYFRLFLVKYFLIV